MKIVVLIARLLLGLVFFVFGLNGFLKFIPMGTLPTGLAGQFLTVLFQSHYVLLISAVELIGGALLLINRFVPLGLTLLGPIIVNILAYHLLLAHEGIGLACVIVILWAVVAYDHRSAFAGILAAKPQ